MKKYIDGLYNMNKMNLVINGDDDDWGEADSNGKD